MLKVLRKNIFCFSSPIRRQNFFELNPIYPDFAQKEFDIYNSNYKQTFTKNLTINDETRYGRLKEKLQNEYFLKEVHEKDERSRRGQYEIDQSTGFPIGMHDDFDDFIEIFKREEKVGKNIIGEFQELVMKLMQKLQVKSELELIKIFRFNLANIKKRTFKDKLRSLLINSAFIKFIKDRKIAGKNNDSLDLKDLQIYFNNEGTPAKKETNEISTEELEELAFRKSLEEIDKKIMKVQEQFHKKALVNNTFVPLYHSTYGQAIREQTQSKLDFDLNYPRGFNTQLKSNENGYTSSEMQERFIQSRINKFFFLRALNQVQSKKELPEEILVHIQELPLNIRKKQKLINDYLYKYKELDLLSEPNLEELYSQIDIALKKINVRVVPNLLDNETQNQEGEVDEAAVVKERIISKDSYLWLSLDVQEIFDPDHYEQQQVQKIKLQEKQIIELSPSSTMELSLNKLPMNLYRHADLDNFNVFNKYRKQIYKDYITDKIINPDLQFRFFSLEQAQQKLNKIKRKTDVDDKFYGYGKRKSTEAQVYVVKGTGKVIINGQPLADYCGDVYHRGQALKPLIFTETAGQYDLQFTVVGGGIHSQAECMSIALTNALIMINPKYKNILAGIGLVGIDDRKKQAKKIGLYSARVRPPYVRR